jgi:anti-anti-sigma factor
MTAMTTTDPLTAMRPDGLRLSTEWLNASVVRISVHGEIDASNSEDVLEYVFRRGANCRTLILNLKDISFFATAGFSALQTLDTRCERAGVSWMLLPSRAVLRVLSVCDPQRSLPCGVA